MDIFETFKKMDLDQIESYISNQEQEDLFLDFKTAKAELTRDDRENFAIALSGFANSSGGLIVWGVVAKKGPNGIDCASQKAPIHPLPLFISRLNQYTGQFVVPVVDDVEHKKIPITGEAGFAVTLVPPSDCGPHMAKGGVGKYYKRSGDSFYPMEHFDIEDMFGRRKKPQLTMVAPTVQRTGIANLPGGITYSLEVTLGIENKGRGPAKSPFLEFSIRSSEGSGLLVRGTRSLGLKQLVSVGGPYQFKFGAGSDVVIHPTTVYHGLAFQVDIHAGGSKLADMVVADMVIDYRIAAEEMKVVEQQVVIPGSHIKAELARKL